MQWIKPIFTDMPSNPEVQNGKAANTHTGVVPGVDGGGVFVKRHNFKNYIYLAKILFLKKDSLPMQLSFIFYQDIEMI